MANEKIINLNNLNRFKQKLNIELDKKANVDGNYPTMTVGAADSLTPYGENSGANDTTPFVMQSSGGSSDVGSKAYLRELRGNTVAFNQLVQNGNFANGIDGWSATTGDAVTATNNVCSVSSTATGGWNSLARTFNVDTSHVYLMAAEIRGVSGSGNVRFRFPLLTANFDLTSSFKKFAFIVTSPNATYGYYIQYQSADGNAFSFEVKNCMCIDLTLMFGAGNEPTTVLEFNRLLPKPYYPYNSGTLLSCKVNGIKNVGYNAFDGIIEGGSIGNGIDISPTTAPNNFRSKNYIGVIQGETYTFEVNSTLGVAGIYLQEYDANKNFIVQQTKYNSFSTFTLGNNTRYVRFQCYKANSGWGANPPTQDTAQIAFHLTWDGSRTGYEPYKEWQYALPNIELRSAGSVYGVAYSTGGGKRRVGVVDLSTLGWIKYGDNQGVYRTNPANLTDMENTTTSSNSNHYLTCVLPEVSNNDAFAGTKECIAKELGRIIISIPSATDGTSLLQKLSGKMLNYPLATETDITVEENPGWQNPQDIDDFGTQEFLYDNDITIPVPQGNDFFYPVDYKAFVDSLGGREDIEYDASEIVSQTQLSASEDDRDKVDTQLQNALCGTLRQLLAINQSIDFLNTDWVDLGTLSWIKDGNNFRTSDISTLIKIPANNTTVVNAICSKYKAVSYDTSFVNGMYGVSSSGYLYVRDTTFADATAFKNAMKGVLLAYEKA